MASRLKIPSLGALARSYQRSLRALARATKAQRQIFGVSALAPKKRAPSKASPPKRAVASAQAASSARAPAKVRPPAAPTVGRAATRSSTAGHPLGQWLSGIAPGPAGARRYHLYVPAGVSASSPTRLPLLVMLHGCGQTGHDLAASTRMNQRAARECFLVLYPEQERVANAQGCWRWFDRRRGRADAEADTLLAAIDHVSARYPVHPGRIAVAGLSAGASMAAWMALRAPGRFCALAMHSGAAPGSAESAASALAAMRGERAPKAPEPARSTAGRSSDALAETGSAGVLPALPPLFVMHGAADNVVALRNAERTALWWADALDARPTTPRTQQRGARHAMRVTEYRSRGKVQVVLREVAGLGHAWSGGAASLAFSDPAGPDATALVWAFVARQFDKRLTSHTAKVEK